MRRLTFQISLAIALAIPATSEANSLCAKFLTRVQQVRQRLFPPQVSFEERNKVKNLEIGRRRREAAVQLNRILFPLMRELQTAANGLTHAEIEARLKDLDLASPIHTGRFQRGSAVLADEELQQKFRNNALQVLGYRLDEHPQVNRLDEFVYVQPDARRIERMGLFHRSLSASLTPVGFYGDKFATDLLRTTQIMAGLVEEFLTERSTVAFQENRDFLSQNLHRAKMATAEEAAPELSLNSAMIEGILTFSQMAGVLINTGVPGMATGDDALRALVFGGRGRFGLTTEFTNQVPAGVVAPMAHAGMAFRNAVIMDSDGRIILSDEMKATLAQLTLNANSISKCPMAAIFRRLSTDPMPDPTTNNQENQPGLQILAETFFRIFSTVSSITRF